MTDPRDDPDATSETHPMPEGVAVALYRISSFVTRIDDVASAIDEILREVSGHFGCDAAMLALIDPDTGSLRVEHLLNCDDDLADATIPSGVGLIGWVALHNTPLLVTDVQRDPRDVPVRKETRSSIVLPLQIDGQLNGVFSLEKDQPDGFADDDLKTASKLIDEAGRALRQLWTLDRLRRKADQFEVLSGIARELPSKLELVELLQTVTKDTVRVADCVAASIQLFDPERRTLTLHAIHPFQSEDPDSLDVPADPVPLEECLSGSAIITRKQLEFSHLQGPAYEDLRDIPTIVPVESVLSTPLLDGEEVTGVLNIYTDRSHRFSNDERRLLRSLANVASVALQNVRLYERVFKSEESLRQSERLTTLGLLAAEIAHETRNPLTVIRLLFGALNLKFDDGDPRNTDVDIIREKLDQLEAFVGRVLSFGKAPESMHTRVDLDDIIRETCLLLRLKLTQAQIHLHYEPPEKPVTVECNKGQIQQVLLNLMLNSVHAMPEGGNITIETRTIREEGGMVACIDISDTGPGIPEEYQTQIFESFLSVRTEGGGTGLGLSIAKRIMRSHHGNIEIAQTGSDGTTMRITLPATQ